MLVKNGFHDDEKVALSELLLHDLKLALGTIVLCVLLDELMKRIGYLPSDKTGRYFSLHVLVNLYVSVVHIDDVIAVYSDPARAPFLSACDTRGTAVIFGLHLYHLLHPQYRPLPTVDVVHHVVMCVVMLPLAWAYRPGPMLGHGSWFASGLPGGLDYAMLVLVKLGLMQRITEKRVNANIQLWLRAPGCLFHALLTWSGYLEWQKLSADHPSVPNTSLLPLWAELPAVVVIVSTFFWNGLYFLSRVLANTAVEEHKLVVAKTKQ
jgi:hypothetical protein